LEGRHFSRQKSRPSDKMADIDQVAWRVLIGKDLKDLAESDEGDKHSIFHRI
jgi:hypothetical protein